MDNLQKRIFSKIHPANNKKRNNWIFEDHENANISQMEEDTAVVFKPRKDIPEK